MNTSPSPIFEISHSTWPKDLRHQVRIVFVKSGLEMCGFVPTLAYYKKASNTIENVPTGEVPVLQRIFLLIILVLQRDREIVLCLNLAKMELSCAYE